MSEYTGRSLLVRIKHVDCGNDLNELFGEEVVIPKLRIMTFELLDEMSFEATSSFLNTQINYIDKKIKKPYYEAIARGDKRHEIRVDKGRNYFPDDLLLLREIAE